LKEEKQASTTKAYLIYAMLMLPFIFFSYVMLTKVVPYLSFARGINFLSTKADTTLDNTFFITGFYIHITSSLLVLVAGIPQFLPQLTKKYISFHRWSGKVYVFLILCLAAPSGLILAEYANGGIAAQAGFTMQCLVWWCCTFMAYKKIREKNFKEHIGWMIRSYAVTLAAMSLRTEGYFMHYFFHTKPIETYITITWLSWVGNLFVAEALIVLGLDKFLLKKYIQNSLT
jgi:hypothetical protein